MRAHESWQAEKATDSHVDARVKKAIWTEAQVHMGWLSAHQVTFHILLFRDCNGTHHTKSKKPNTAGCVKRLGNNLSKIYITDFRREKGNSYATSPSNAQDLTGWCCHARSIRLLGTCSYNVQTLKGAIQSYYATLLLQLSKPAVCPLPYSIQPRISLSTCLCFLSHAFTPTQLWQLKYLRSYHKDKTTT